MEKYAKIATIRRCKIGTREYKSEVDGRYVHKRVATGGGIVSVRLAP